MQDGPNNPFMPGGEYENTDKESTFTRMDKVLEDFKLELQKAQENNDVAKIQELIEEIELQKQSIDDLLEAMQSELVQIENGQATPEDFAKKAEEARSNARIEAQKRINDHLNETSSIASAYGDNGRRD